MISARFRHSERYPASCTIDVRGITESTIFGLSPGQAYALHEALAAALEDYEEYVKKAIEAGRIEA